MIGIQTTYAIQSLGETAEEVAVTLHSGGWLGSRKTSRECPVAQYLRTAIPEVSGAVVGSEHVTVRAGARGDVAIGLTPAVAGFVLAFDVGVYPDLVAGAVA